VTAFIIIATLMVAAALAWLLWPLLRPTSRRSLETRAANITVFKDQFADLDADLTRGTISQDQYVEAKSELERRMIEEAGSAVTTTVAPPLGGRKTAVALIVAVPVLASMIYLKLGEPDAFSPLATSGQDPHQMSGEQVDAMVTRLAQRLEKEPENVDGWVILARTYYTQRRFGEAAAAYERLTRLLPNEADLFADYADALAMAQGRQITGKPMELVQKALAIDPNQWKALAMAGTEAFDRKDYKGAVEYWERLRASAGDNPIAQQIQGSIDEARKLGGMPASAPSATVPMPAAASKAAPAASAPKTEAPVAAGGGNVAGTVTLAGELAGKAGPNDAIFVMARPADGSKMPIAITRAQVKDLPLKFTLDDSASMSPQTKISGFNEVIVAARVSKSGSAMPTAGDFEGTSKPVKVGSSGVAITIDRVIP
jgi:cytochrome c-type biogenesis protein CcmH